MSELHHGGRLREAAARYGIPLDEWLDLSTGINPVGWPVPQLPTDCWQRLPEKDDGLEAAAESYYGNHNLLAVAGSQVAIQLLPRLRQKGRVGMLQPSYAEHEAAWRRAGHQVLELTPATIDESLPTLDVLLLINPNNPTGKRFSPEQLLHWHEQLQGRAGWLVVDEAFIDATPQFSLVRHCGQEGLVVLRSMGKFFGLAGVRAGFVFAWPLLLQRMIRELGPWHVSGPAREVVRRALLDNSWQAQTRTRLEYAGSRLSALLGHTGLKVVGGTALFHYVQHPLAPNLHELLAQQGIFTRLFSSPAALRFGLPGSEDEWQRLQQQLVIAQQQLSRKVI